MKQHWVLPKPDDPDFVCAMEDVLDVYQRPRDPLRPLVTLDEASKQLVADVTPPMPLQPGRPTRQDYEYERRGTANLFMLFAPLEGWRHVKVTDRRTIVDFAHVLRDLSDVHFPDAQKIVLMDRPKRTAKDMAGGGWMIVNTLKSIVENGKPPLKTRIMYWLFAHMEFVLPKRTASKNWPLD